ncbi:MAG: DNA alkylation repair protein, partial [Thermoanaerobaculia bacterium]|nr:DNA alkylation repair protein [Thermoanaerobaculia bacterium]
HGRPNRTRHSMNQALICIGTRTAGLKRKAQAAAKRIGKVEVDHGQTSCKTPEAAPSIEKAYAHRHRKRAARAR